MHMEKIKIPPLSVLIVMQLFIYHKCIQMRQFWAPSGHTNTLAKVLYIGIIIFFFALLIGRLVTIYMMFLKHFSTIWQWRCRQLALDGSNFLTVHNHLLFYNNCITKSGEYNYLLVVSFRKCSQAYIYMRLPVNVIFSK